MALNHHMGRGLPITANSQVVLPDVFGDCHGQVWRIDDFTQCFKNDYLRTLFPLCLCGLSILHILYTAIRLARRSSHNHTYRIIQNLPGPWGTRPAQAQGAEEDHEHGSEDDSDSDMTNLDDEFSRNAQLGLHPTISQVDRTTYLEADKPRGQVTLVCIEWLSVLGEVIIQIVTLLLHVRKPGSKTIQIAPLASWTYVLVLVSIRVVCTWKKKSSTPALWYHTTWLYGLNWVFSVLLFRSSIIHPSSGLGQDLAIADFALNTLLALIALSSRQGNREVEIELEGDIPPPREPKASLISLASFSWVDRIVWVGYKKTLEMNDVWNLVPQDKAGSVLANYRQVKKTTALIWHLLRFFRKPLLVQALWAGGSGVLTFVPTLLLREILRYIEAPQDHPRSMAWTWVILLFVSGAFSALADGQALWIGRRMCINIRAIIIGELYAKALKRKVATSGDRVLGEKKVQDESISMGKKTFLAQFTDRFKKKKAPKADKTDNPKDDKKVEGAEDTVTSGTIINLMAVDSFKIAETTSYLHFLWASTPVQLVMCLVLLYQTLGFSSIAGIGLMFALLPINVYISNRFAAIQKRILAATDARIHTTNEVLTNIRIIKFFAWEQRFMANINEKRVVELKELRYRYLIWTIAGTIWGGAPILIAFLSFAVYTFGEKRDLVPSVAFTALSLFQLLRIPLDQLADMFAHVLESKVSVDRVEEFLNEEDTQKYKQLRNTDDDADAPTIGFVNGNFTWGGKTAESEEESDAFRLMDLDLRFEPGQLNVVAGPTGSGKTSLLMALLGEMTLLTGSVYLPGGRSREDMGRDAETGLTESVAYCAQQAWLVNGSVKDNILFSSPMNKRRYEQVIKACALEKDLQILDKGDETLVGEKGVTLSGGQKQRISLARALYSHARHVLLDDILSAVDSHTAKWIFDEALMGPLMYNRTCILVTHNIALCLPHAQYAVVIDNGRVTVAGTVETIIKSGKLGQDLTNSKQNSRTPSRVPSVTTSESEEGMASTLTNNSATAVNDTLNDSVNTDKFATEDAGIAKAKGSEMSQSMEEGKAVGGVKLGIIIMYLKAMGGWPFWTLATTLFVGQQIANVATNVWISEWANAYASRRFDLTSLNQPSNTTFPGGSNDWISCLTSRSCVLHVPHLGSLAKTYIRALGSDDVNDGYYLAIYGLLGVVYMSITFLREGVLFLGSLQASKAIHDELIDRVSRAKFRFFDSTPLGQIMNRFSKDIEQVDQEIAPVAVGVIYCATSIITIVVLISIITPAFLIAGFFITILYTLIGYFYINSSRDLKRIEAVQRSPLYQQFGETLTGVTTIRAYGDERRFIRDNLKQVNTHNRPFIYLWGANRWLAFRVDVVGALVSFFTGVFVIISVGKINAGAAGLALSYAVTFTENVLWFVRLYAMNEQNMNSVERIKEYLDVDQEAAPIVEKNRPSGDWPSRGEIEFVGYSTRYRKDFDLVLKDLTFKINPCEKIGVVGRTGAGKSSLAMALFRAIEAEEGKIMVDGVDISSIGLQDLRENIVMVPQDPTLFSGTIRGNVDPFGLFTDEEIFNVLRRVQLIGVAPTNPPTPSASRPVTPKAPQLFLNGTELSSSSDPATSVPSTPHSQTMPENKNIFLNLSSTITESGSNLSQGQRQLLCLARALLKEPKVLLMDEATASIDYATDAKVQDTIRELKQNTIITIAHRLKTIVDYDRVIVMEKGRVVEMGAPWDLLRTDGEGHSGDNGKRWFREMCETSDDIEALETEARKSWESKRLVNDD